MYIELPAGRYVVAVSGGVDSVALLHMLAARPDLKLTVAHFDHGIREDSAEDMRLVRGLAKKYRLPFVTISGRLGEGTSEAVARKARYQFLHDVRKASGAGAIVTAHHQDDLLETAILNLLRGTGSRGLSSLKSMDIVRRPLLHISKKELLDYALAHKLEWREDSTNVNEAYMRNYVRKQIVPRLGDDGRTKLIDIVKKAHGINQEVQVHIINYLHMQPASHTLDRPAFVMLPHAVAREVLAEWLRMRTDVEVSKKLLERLVVAAKTARAGSKIDIDVVYWLNISEGHLALTLRER